MRRICNILAVSLTVILYASCEAGPPMSDQMAGMPVIYGKITDMEGTPLEHIKVTIDWGSYLMSPDVEYTNSDGEFRARIRYSGENGQPATITVTMTDIDGEENGGLFETLTETLTLFEEDIYTSNEVINLAYRLNHATVSENSPQS
ncbi:MAG: radical SAM-associated putative lipoprotein [Bacteroidales bacterium]|nr:radical SAM-associated putative lipoprotein [Bacteroidales bacterium]